MRTRWGEKAPLLLKGLRANVCGFPWVVTGIGPGGFMICVCIFFYENAMRRMFSKML